MNKPKKFEFQTNSNGKVTHVNEMLESGEHVPVKVYLDVINNGKKEVSFTITPNEIVTPVNERHLILRTEEQKSGSGEVKDIGITPGNEQPAPRPGDDQPAPRPGD